MPTTNEPKRALIFGISGQDGTYLSQLLLRKGYQVHGTSRNAGPVSCLNLKKLGLHDQVTIHAASPCNQQSVKDVIKHIRPEEIYNLEGPSSVAYSFEHPEESFETITLSTLHILKAILSCDPSIRYYNATSSECFGDTGESGANEQTPFDPQSPYARAKSETFRQTALHRETFSLFACSGILFNHESPLRPDRFVTQKIIAGAARIAAENSGVLTLGNLDIRRDWGWAPEYVDAMWRMLQQDHPDDYVIATGESSSLRDFTDTAFSHFGLDWRNYVQSDPSLFRPADITNSSGDASKAQSILKWRAEKRMKDIVRLMADSLTRESD